MICTKFEVV